MDTTSQWVEREGGKVRGVSRGHQQTSVISVLQQCLGGWSGRESVRLSAAPFRNSMSEGSQRSEFSLVLVSDRSALEVTRGQSSVPNVLRQCPSSVC